MVRMILNNPNVLVKYLQLDNHDIQGCITLHEYLEFT